MLPTISSRHVGSLLSTVELLGVHVGWIAELGAVPQRLGPALDLDAVSCPAIWRLTEDVAALFALLGLRQQLARVPTLCDLRLADDVNGALLALGVVASRHSNNLPR
jgi:hypothetical protein